MQQISARQLSDWLEDPARGAPALIDVREPWEFDVCRIDGSALLPMRALAARLDELDPHAETVVICHHGARSMQVCLFLERQGFGRVFNLSGGVHAWAQDVDPKMPTY
jgi:rhodanese-related sulfurtransferase